MNLVGKRLGDYEVVGELGQGGMGIVYLGRNVHLPSMIVALKILKEEFLQDRFLREAANLNRLSHTNICQIKHFFRSEHGLVIALEYIDGETLQEVLRRQRVLDLQWVRSVFCQVLEGLVHAHANGIQHRDIKSSNIMIDANNVVRLIDFGIARRIDDPGLTSTGTEVGTPQYMAPEQFTAIQGDVDYCLTDVYSTGICLYEASCGRLPFEDTNRYVLREKHCHETPVPLSRIVANLPRGWENVILKAIAKKPSRRFQSAAELRDALMSVRLGSSAPSTTIVKTSPLARWRGSRRLVAGLVALLAITVIVIVFLSGKVNLLGERENWNQQIPVEWVCEIESQTVDSTNSFETVQLPEARQNDPRGHLQYWKVDGDDNLQIKFADDFRTATVSSRDSEWWGAETLTFIAIFEDGSHDSASAIYSVEQRNQPPRSTGEIRREQKLGSGFSAISLRRYVEDPDDAFELLVWDHTPSVHFWIEIESGRAYFGPRDPKWIGQETFYLLVTDPHGASDSVRTTLAVSAPVQPAALQYDSVEQQSPAPDSLPQVPLIVAQEQPSPSLQIRVLPAETGIYLSGRLVDRDSFYLAKLDSDIYLFSLKHYAYPIHDIRIAVDSSSIDTLVDLNSIFDSAATGRFACFAKAGGKKFRTDVSVNGFRNVLQTNAIPEDLVPSGYYEVELPALDSLQLDSVKIQVPGQARMIREMPERVFVSGSGFTYVYFYLSQSFKE